MFKAIVFCSLVAFALAKPSEEQMMKWFDACVTEMNVDKSVFDDIEAAMKNPALKCFAKCLYEKANLIENGVIMRPKMMAWALEMGPEIAKEVQKCIDITDPDICEEATKMMCCKKKLKDMM